MSHPPVIIVYVGYRSTNYWVISAGRARLLVDIGWPGSLGMMKAQLSGLMFRSKKFVSRVPLLKRELVSRWQPTIPGHGPIRTLE